MIQSRAAGRWRLSGITVAEKAGAGGWRCHGMPRSPPFNLTRVLLPASIGMEQQTPIAAPHQGEPEAGETNRAITQVVAFPAALGQIAGAEKDTGDFAVGRVIETCVKRTQSEDEAVAAGLREVGGIGTRGAASQPAPEPDCGHHADFEELVERQ